MGRKSERMFVFCVLSKADRKLRSYQTGSYVPQNIPYRTDHQNNSGDSNSISKSEKALLNAKVYPRTIKRLIEEFPEDRILQKLEHFAEGELVRAIEEDWQPRKGHRSSERDYQPDSDFWDDGEKEKA